MKLENCPIPQSGYSLITLAHGGGGLLSHRLFEQVFLPAFDNEYLRETHDGAVLPQIHGPLAITTDAHVVQPLVFPGGDIGTLAVCGSLNDLAMCGAEPKYLSMSFILEEGLPIEVLQKIVESIAKTARAEKVVIVTGDTKVVEKGRCEGMYISTTAIGEIKAPNKICPQQIQSGDVLILSSDIARHGMAVMSCRPGFQFESGITSDCGSLWPAVQALLQEKVQIHCLRDLTRGGLAAGATELSKASGFEFEVHEEQIPVQNNVRAACEIFGLDPIHVANEGCFLAVVAATDADRCVRILQAQNGAALARKIGFVTEAKGSAHVWIKGAFGQRRMLILPTGEQLPRIC